MSYSSRNISELQVAIAPKVYGDIDLNIQPERFRTTLGENSRKKGNSIIEAKLADKNEVEFFRQLTLMGDPIADAYAVLIPEIGMKKARAMLEQALEHGIDSVEDAPQELKNFIAALEEQPEWLDLNEIEKVNHKLRLPVALGFDIGIRVAFMLTYFNGYQGLPMIMTGTLSSESAAKRMKETTSTFRIAVLPHAMSRKGEAFKSAAMVRLMHAMVRTNLLRKKDKWDYQVYGVPIPQVDQMGAALMGNYRMAKLALKQKRKFNKYELRLVNQARYLAFLLGLHDQFLSDDPQQIVHTWQMCQATLKHKFDPRTKDLNEATLAAYRRPNQSAFNQFVHRLEVKSSKFLYTTLFGRKATRQMGVTSNLSDALALGLLGVPVGLKIAVLGILQFLPSGKWVDQYAITLLRKQLDMDGKAEYLTDEKKYQMNAG